MRRETIYICIASIIFTLFSIVFVYAGGKNSFKNYNETDCSYFDFDINKKMIVGLSELGKNKIKKGDFDLIIPSSIEGVEVKSIGRFCFFENKNITSIVIPSSVNRIEFGAFKDCKNLMYVTLSENISEIDTYAFSGCEKLKYIKLPEKLEYIGEWSFSKCEKLIMIEFPEDLKIIESWAFEGCKELECITFNKKPYYIGRNVFMNCNKVKFTNINMNIYSEYVFNI